MRQVTGTPRTRQRAAASKGQTAAPAPSQEPTADEEAALEDLLLEEAEAQASEETQGEASPPHHTPAPATTNELTPGTARRARLNTVREKQLEVLRVHCGKLGERLAATEQELEDAKQAHDKLITTTRRTARDHMERANAAVAARKETDRVLANAEKVHGDALRKLTAERDDARAESGRLGKALASAQREAQNLRAQLERAMDRVPALECTVCASPLPKSVEIASVCAGCATAML